MSDAESAQRPPIRDDERPFLDSIQAAHQIEKMPAVNWALYLVIAFLVTVLTWAAIAKVDIVTRADARIIPDGREQSIASLEGGILRQLHVHEGMEVSAGQVVATLDPTRVAAMQNEGRAKRIALLATLARLQAEVSGENLVFPSELAAYTDVIAAETDTHNARQQALDDAQSSDQRSLELLNKEVAMAQELADSGLMPNVEVMRLRRQAGELAQQRKERKNQMREQASSQLSRVQNDLAQLDEQLVVRDDVLERTTLRSPVRGLVKNIRVATEGGVVAAGMPIMEIVPLGGRVLIEARIKPADIGFVREGHQAKIKLSAYEYNLYGGLEGKVQYISPDALSDTGTGRSADRTYYRARILTDKPTIQFRGELLPVRPGMTGTVEISTNERSILSFLLRPILKSRDAFRQP
jgi:adhesin transport system membrane fusion protein